MIRALTLLFAFAMGIIAGFWLSVRLVFWRSGTPPEPTVAELAVKAATGRRGLDWTERS